MLRFVAVSVCVLAFVPPLPAADPLEKRCQDVLDEYAAIQKVLGSIRDKQSAEKADKELQFLTELPTLKGVVGEVSSEKQLAWLAKEFDTLVFAAKKKMANTFLEVKHVSIDRVSDVEHSKFGRLLIETFHNDSELKARNIRTACKAFYIRTGGDSWPEELKVLIAPENGGRAYIEGGVDAITNVWGKPFQFRIEETKDGPKPVVFTEVPFPTKWTTVEFR